jgi:uncharacterized membrane protein YsdA (DUF1294 family)
VTGIFVLTLAGLTATGHVHWIIATVYLILSLAAFALYAIDKMSAAQGARRVRESTLHLAALLGGWPGAYAAQQLLRHKTVKQPFQAIFITCVSLNIFALMFYSIVQW